jgi:6-pyruvoyltetrahydropterin/6-carboxytetrahydropterin synthase
MTHYLSQRFYFEAAHTLARKHDAESSARVHGHTYHAEVTVTGDVLGGMVEDLAFLRTQIYEVRRALDHQMLNDVPELGEPTLENLCTYIAKRMPMACKVAVWREASGDRCELLVD